MLAILGGTPLDGGDGGGGGGGGGGGYEADLSPARTLTAMPAKPDPPSLNWICCCPRSFTCKSILSAPNTPSRLTPSGISTGTSIRRGWPPSVTVISSTATNEVNWVISLYSNPS